MNPVLTDVLSFLSDRRTPTAYTAADVRSGTPRVTFTFADGTSEARAYECDAATFLWWCGEVSEQCAVMAGMKRELEGRL